MSFSEKEEITSLTAYASSQSMTSTSTPSVVDDELMHLIVTRDLSLSVCREAGRKGSLQKVVDQAVEAIRSAEKVRRKVASSDVPATTARHGNMNEVKIRVGYSYTGYALAKMERYGEAVPFLEKAIDRHHCGFEQTRQYQLARQALQECREKLSVASLKQTPRAHHMTKFPRIPHLFSTGNSTEDDIVLEDENDLYHILCNVETQVHLEEKIDGANMGFSLCSETGRILAQNRSHFISSGDHVQFSRLEEWIQEHRSVLHQLLVDETGKKHRILYGEWMVARHSIPYHKLPGSFVAFDLYDVSEGKFFSRRRFHAALKGSGIPVVPFLQTRTLGPFHSRQKAKQLKLRNELMVMLETKSMFRVDGGTLEGIVLRVDDGDWLQNCTKIVRSDFIAGCGNGHWMRRDIEKQAVDYEFALSYLETCYVLAEEQEGSNVTNTDVSRLTKIPKEVARARRQAPRVVMLMGLPGSGKTTFARRLATSGDWIHVNQDDFGKRECVKLASKANKSTRVVLDRCNPTVSERQDWFDTMHSPNKGVCALLYFNAPLATCIERVKSRVGHPTIPTGKGEGIVHRVARGFEPPTDHEIKKMFGTYKVIETFEDTERLLKSWGVLFDSL